MLTSHGVFADEVGPRVLDLYAGSGALGLEAISRGARSAVFVESGRPALATIRENTRTLGVDEQVTIVPLRVDRALGEVDGPFDLVLIDPPYADVRAKGFGEVLEKAAELLSPTGIIVVEHASTDEPGPPPGMTLDRRRRHGDTTLSLFRNTSSTGPEDAATPESD